MSYETLKQALLQEAQNQADAISEDFAAKAAKEQQRIQDRAQATEETLIAQATAEGAAIASRLHQEHQLTAKANILIAKQTELETTQAQVISTILAWDKAATKALLSDLLKHAPKDAEIIAGQLHHSVLKAARATNIADETIANEGGFIARSPHEESNLLISHLVAQLFVRHRAAIAQQLLT